MNGHKSRLLLAVVAAMLMATAPVFAFGIARTQARARDAIAQRFRERARIAAELTTSLFSSSFRTAQTLNAKSYAQAHVSARTLDITARDANLNYVILLGPDGHVIAASSGASARALRQVDAPAGPAKRVLAGAPYFVASQLRLGPSAAVIPSAQSIITPFGRRVLLTGTPAPVMYRFLGAYIHDLPTTVGGDAYVTDANDAVLGSPNRGVTPGRPLPEPRLRVAISSGSYGRFVGDRYFASYPVGGSAWRVVLTASGAALFASVDGVTRWLPWVVLASFAIVAALTIMLLRRVAVTNRRLARANEDLERNVAELNDSQERLAHEALHDALTELPNRTLFDDRLAQALARSERLDGHRCAVLFIDLDRFKVINDGFSHAAGDELLVALARRLGESLRPGDTVARFGGDEFTVLLCDVKSHEEACEIAGRLGAGLEQPFQLGGRELFVTASIGVALSSGGAGADELLRNADTAMYDAKAQGNGHVSVFDASMHTRIVRKVGIETELREAIERRRLTVFYQPIVDLGSGGLSGFEALVRWPERSETVHTEEFIAVAEESGLIDALGAFVLDEACMRLSDWRRRGLVEDHVTMSVNVSARQLNTKLADDITAALTRSGLPPDALRLEITETTVMNAPERVNDLLAELERTGVRAQIDDFGTGYSSLSLLHGFPGDALKIDRTFIASLHENESSEAIVSGIIALAHNLNLEVIAEGIDHPAHLTKLRHLGCEYAQGFLLCEPRPAEALEGLIQAWDAKAITDIDVSASDLLRHRRTA